MRQGEPGSIGLNCVCGASIAVPAKATGQEARCNACGRVVTVPVAPWDPDSPDTRVGASPAPAAPGEAAATKATGEPQPDAGSLSSGPGDGLDGLLELDEVEEEPSSRRKKPAGLTMAANTPDVLAPPAQTPPRERLLDDLRELEADRQGVRGPTRSFWADLLLGFGFLLDTNNFSSATSRWWRC